MTHLRYTNHNKQPATNAIQKCPDFLEIRALASAICSFMDTNDSTAYNMDDLIFYQIHYVELKGLIYQFFMDFARR